jgi:hypothetical protein
MSPSTWDTAAALSAIVDPETLAAFTSLISRVAFASSITPAKATPANNKTPATAVTAAATALLVNELNFNKLICTSFKEKVYKVKKTHLKNNF